MGLEVFFNMNSLVSLESTKHKSQLFAERFVIFLFR